VKSVEKLIPDTYNPDLLTNNFLKGAASITSMGDV